MLTGSHLLKCFSFFYVVLLGRKMAPAENVDDPKSTKVVVTGKKSSPKKVNGSKWKAWCWDHFIELKDSKTPRTACNYCGVTYACDSKNNGTHNLINHITNKCKVYQYNNEDKKQKDLSFEWKKEEGVTIVILCPLILSLKVVENILLKWL